MFSCLCYDTLSQGIETKTIQLNSNRYILTLLRLITFSAVRRVIDGSLRGRIQKYSR